MYMRSVLLGTQSAALTVKTIFKCLYFSPQTILGVPSIICPATTGTTLLLLGSMRDGWEHTQIKLFFGATSIPTTYHITKLSATIWASKPQPGCWLCSKSHENDLLTLILFLQQLVTNQKTAANIAQGWNWSSGPETPLVPLVKWC